MEKIRVLDLRRDNASLNMALDEAITRTQQGKESIATLRFYTWPLKTITIGNAQDINEFDLGLITRKSYPLMRRPTGGTAIFHDDDITYSFIAKEEYFSENVRTSTQEILEGIRYGLKEFGLEAVFRGEERDRKTSSCATNKNPYDLMVNKKKIAPAAQARINSVILLQGIIPIKPYNIEALAETYKISEKERNKLVETTKKRVISLEEALGRETTISEVNNAFRKGFEKAYENKFLFEPGELTGKEIEKAERIETKIYMNPNWTYKAERK